MKDMVGEPPGHGVSATKTRVPPSVASTPERGEYPRAWRVGAIMEQVLHFQGPRLKGFVFKGFVFKGFISKGFVLKSFIFKSYVFKGFAFKCFGFNGIRPHWLRL
eukprot:CAMPEP_0172652794 /NCGR_PEP_ID=MMETSP1068-20121228/243497_1 /TAXON_ID=35684 /ORGANISM="Pseudopedinella elastica, Strain CCMP716" /LENGTH=104 /DNA_ID=CAMNT_0013467213 /DNA_START=1132 /DNA_END=1446 /DNA_ORIENTATION=-